MSNAQPDIAPHQLDLFGRGNERDGGLDAGLWSRHQDRHDHERSAGLSREDITVAPLVLALARLTAQRDARLIVQSFHT